MAAKVFNMAVLCRKRCAETGVRTRNGLRYRLGIRLRATFTPPTAPQLFVLCWRVRACVCGPRGGVQKCDGTRRDYRTVIMVRVNAATVAYECTRIVLYSVYLALTRLICRTTTPSPQPPLGADPKGGSLLRNCAGAEAKG